MRRKQAFTLMELLVVMGIMALIGSILVASYFGMIRAGAYSAAATDFHNLMLLSRQRACMDGVRTMVMLVDSNSYVIVRAAGVITEDGQDSGSETLVRDAYTDIASFPSTEHGARVWNMDRDASARLIRVASAAYNDAGYSRTEIGLFMARTNDSGGAANSDKSWWKKDDHYGLELYPRQQLPKGFLFNVNGAVPKNSRITFEPDGSSRGVNGMSSGTDKIEIIEKIASDVPANRVTLSITHPSADMKVVK